ncbi:MAG TPA: hypothetical protein DC059_07770 [Dietzia sp.]|nr:hypothetical protein [Dietzia sp.]
MPKQHRGFKSLHFRLSSENFQFRGVYGTGIWSRVTVVSEASIFELPAAAFVVLDAPTPVVAVVLESPLVAFDAVGARA